MVTARAGPWLSMKCAGQLECPFRAQTRCPAHSHSRPPTGMPSYARTLCVHCTWRPCRLCTPANRPGFADKRSCGDTLKILSRSPCPALPCPACRWQYITAQVEIEQRVGTSGKLAQRLLLPTAHSSPVPQDKHRCAPVQPPGPRLISFVAGRVSLHPPLWFAVAIIAAAPRRPIMRVSQYSQRAAAVMMATRALLSDRARTRAHAPARATLHLHPAPRPQLGPGAALAP
jgi:hypothetical protein